MSEDMINSLEALVASAGDDSICEKTSKKITANNDELLRVRAMANTLLSRLEGHLNDDAMMDKEQFYLLWGERENALSILTKITQILSKTIPLEKISDEKWVSSEEVTEEEIAIFERYVLRCIEEETII